MPQLDLTNYFNLIFWSLVTFALLYFTVSRSFCKKIEKLLKQREDNIQRYISGAEELSEQTGVIERQMKHSEAEFLKQIDAVQKKEGKQVFQELERIKKDFFNKSSELKEAHKLCKRKISEDFMHKMSSQSKKIDSLIENYLFK